MCHCSLLARAPPAAGAGRGAGAGEPEELRLLAWGGADARGVLLRDHDGPRRSPCCAAVERARGAAGRLSWADFEARVHYVLYCEDDWGTSDLGALHEGECGEPAPPEDR